MQLINTFKQIKSYTTHTKKIIIKTPCKYIKTDILNIIRKLIFATTHTPTITHMAINKAKHMFSFVNGLEEDTLTITLNLKDIKSKLHHCKTIEICILKTGKCFISGKDIQIKNFLKVINPNKIITRITQQYKQVKLKLKIGNTKTNTKTYISYTQRKNTIKLTANSTPIKKVAIGHTKHTSFITITTNKTICPILCFINAYTQLTKTLTHPTLKLKPYQPLIIKNKHLHQPIHTLNIKQNLITALKINKCNSLIETISFKNLKAHIMTHIKYKTQLIKELIKQGFYNLK